MDNNVKENILCGLLGACMGCIILIFCVHLPDLSRRMDSMDESPDDPRQFGFLILEIEKEENPTSAVPPAFRYGQSPEEKLLEESGKILEEMELEELRERHLRFFPPHGNRNRNENVNENRNENTVAI